jgi:hypothetical protein
MVFRHIVRVKKTKQGEMGVTCGTYGDKRNSYRIFGGKIQSERLQGRPRRRWEDNIKIVIKVEWRGPE